MIRVGVIGYGYWGPNLVRNFAELADARVTVVADRRPERLAQAERRYPGIRVTTDPLDLIADPAVDAVVIATPVATHFELADAALRAGRHVLVEKPLASSTLQARALIDDAAARDLVLMVDHTFVYTRAVRRIREMIAAGDLGELYYYDSVRVNLGLFQHDVNVLWDLAVHDLSIMDYVLGAAADGAVGDGRRARDGSAREHRLLDDVLRGSSHWARPRELAGAREDPADAHRRQPAHDRVRRSRDQREDQGRTTKGFRSSTIPRRCTRRWWVPHGRHVGASSAGDRGAAHRGDTVHRLHSHRPHSDTDGAAGLRVVRLLEAATASMAQHGKPIAFEADAQCPSIRLVSASNETGFSFCATRSKHETRFLQHDGQRSISRPARAVPQHQAGN